MLELPAALAREVMCKLLMPSTVMKPVEVCDFNVEMYLMIMKALSWHRPQYAEQCGRIVESKYAVRESLFTRARFGTSSHLEKLERGMRVRALSDAKRVLRACGGTVPLEVLRMLSGRTQWSCPVCYVTYTRSPMLWKSDSVWPSVAMCCVAGALRGCRLTLTQTL